MKYADIKLLDHPRGVDCINVSGEIYYIKELSKYILAEALLKLNLMYMSSEDLGLKIGIKYTDDQFLTFLECMEEVKYYMERGEIK